MTNVSRYCGDSSIISSRLLDADESELASIIAELETNPLERVQSLATPEQYQDVMLARLNGLIAIAKARNNHPLVKEVAERFDQAWPDSQKLVLKIDDKAPDHAVNEHVDARTSFGYLMARDVYEALTEPAPPIIRIVQLPILMVSEDSARNQDGEIRMLEIGLRKDDWCSAFYPDPLCLGLTQLSQQFFDSMQNVWKASLLADLGVTARWRIKRFPRIDVTIPDRAFHGRSIEAATLCAIWSAYGKVPGQSEVEFQDLGDLDIQSTVIGCLEGLDQSPPALGAAGMRTELKIGAVDSEGVNFKVGKVLDHLKSLSDDAADEPHKKKQLMVDRIFVSAENKDQLSALTRSCENSTLKLFWPETIGTTLLRLLESQRIMEDLQIKSVIDWDAEWFIPKEEKELAGDFE